MALLLSKWQEEQSKLDPTPYLDCVVVAFPQPSRALSSGDDRTHSGPIVAGAFE